MKEIGTKSSVLAALVDAAINDTKLENEFTGVEYLEMCQAKGVDMPYQTAMGRLNRMVRNGQLVKRLVTINRRQTAVYSEPIKTKKKP